jgi:transposase, IS30 family
MAISRRPRPKQGRIASVPRLRDYIQDKLEKRWSPEQISHVLREKFPDDKEMRVCHETIYQALYVQGRGLLRRELAIALRTGRAMRRPRKQSEARRTRFAHPMVMISERPPEADDRAVPGHWEGDLIIGAHGCSAIGTVVERSKRFTMLVYLPNDHTAASVCDGLIRTMGGLPEHLKRSLTWDQGCEMSQHKQFSIVTNIPTFFCDPHSPWQRGSNENTNGLLRQYFPKGTDLSIYTQKDLDKVADELNNRPRKTLGWKSPAHEFAQLLNT